MQMNGYRKMIADNIPKTWDLALKWCHCRNRWINTAYDNYVGVFNNDYRPLKTRNKLKEDAVKRVTLKMKIEGKHMRFRDTVNLDQIRMDADTYEYWNTIAGWVDWFEKNYLLVKQDIDTQMDSYGSSIEETIEYINEKYNMNDIELARFYVGSL